MPSCSMPITWPSGMRAPAWAAGSAPIFARRKPYRFRKACVGYLSCRRDCAKSDNDRWGYPRLKKDNSSDRLGSMIIWKYRFSVIRVEPKFFSEIIFRAKKRPDITSGLLRYLYSKAFYISSSFQIGNSTCLSCHSSMFRQHNRKRPRHNNSRILLQTYRFFSFYLFCSCFHLLIGQYLFPAGSHCAADSSPPVDQSHDSSTAFEVQNKATFCFRSNIPDAYKVITFCCQSN